MPTNSTNDAAVFPRVCSDIDSCRTVTNIVLSCLATVFACVWTAVHRNIPGPSRDMRSRLLNVWDMAKVVAVALLVPEWVLAWAVRQSLNARDVAEALNRAQRHARETWKTKKLIGAGSVHRSRHVSSDPSRREFDSNLI
ncbi:hypothetical protein FA95DRAFT_1683252 [Auriscalpium vulgare]|uniref:Uncharacterized protein n=1 Tax=Auriscalpium vulgare TaxID=40419 RepID=A0ACB8RBX8_9AGAM|nr:hypothetical protein FA95DRAFT_1683252 [Auriscalpium vulgare]